MIKQLWLTQKGGTYQWLTQKKAFKIRMVYLYFMVLSIQCIWEILVEESSLQDTVEDAESSHYVCVCDFWSQLMTSFWIHWVL